MTKDKYQNIDKKEINKLVKLTGEGNYDALQILYKRMYKILFSFLMRYDNNVENIKDVISTTFCIVIEKSKEKMFFHNCFSWILTISKYQLFNHNKRTDKLLLSDKLDKLGYEYKIDSIALKYALDYLEPPDRELLYYIFYAKLNYTEISKLMHISSATIKRKKTVILNSLEEKCGEK